MDFYNDEDYQSKYSWDDFPVEVAYRERLYFEVSIVTLDQSLQVMAANCCSTPTADHNKEHRFRHELIHEGWVKHVKEVGVAIENVQCITDKSDTSAFSMWHLRHSMGHPKDSSLVESNWPLYTVSVRKRFCSDFHLKLVVFETYQGCQRKEWMNIAWGWKQEREELSLLL